MANPYSIKTLLRNAKTQEAEGQQTAGAELVAIAKGSFDKLSFAIVEKQNRLVSCQADRQRFEYAVNKERAELIADEEKAEAELADARREWEAMVAARGLRGLLPVAVERTPCTDLE